MAIFRESRSDDIGGRRQGGSVHGDVDVVAAPGALPPQQRHQNGGQRLQRAEVIGDRNAGNDRLAVAADGHAEHAADRLEREVVRGPLAVRTGIAEGADRAIDDARIARHDRRMADAEAIDDAGAEALHHDVGARAQVEQQVQAVRRLEIEDDALLAAIEIAKEHGRRAVGRTDVASGIAARRLDLDDLGAVIGQGHRQIRSRQEPAEIDHPDICELHVGHPPLN